MGGTRLAEVHVGIYHARGDIAPGEVHNLAITAREGRFALAVVGTRVVEHILYDAVINKNPPFKGETFVYKRSVLEEAAHVSSLL